MLHHKFKDIINSEDELRQLLGQPSQLVIDKELQALDHHCRAFIELSPYLLLGTSNAAGLGDVSPRGDGPGFVCVLDDKTIVIPDRPGNRRADSLRNILANPQVGLLFLIPGFGETLRVNGRAYLIHDEDILAKMAIKGKNPLLGIAVEIRSCFLQCAKATLRSKIWDTDTWLEREALPSLAQMLLEQTKTEDWTVDTLEQMVAKSSQRLY